MAAGDIARWTGAAADGDWDTAGNWTAESGTPSTPPTDAEVALFDHRSGSNSNVTAGLDQSAVDLYRIIVLDGYSGTIGGAGGGLVVSVSDTTSAGPRIVWGSNNGTIYVGGGSEVIDEFWAIGAGRVILTGGTITQTVADPGSRVTINSAATAPTVYGKNAQISDSSSTSGTLLVAIGGRVESARAWTTITNDGAQTRITGGALAVTTMNLYGSGKHTHDSTGTITNLNRFHGDLIAVNKDFTVTNDNNVTGMSRIIQQPGGGKVTVSNANPIGDTSETL